MMKTRSKIASTMLRCCSRKPALAACLVAVAIVGCRETENAQRVARDYRDSSIQELHHLGWMGGTSHPVNQAVTCPDPTNPDVSVSPGGIVVVEVLEDLPLSRADIQAGDLIVRVAEKWLPIKEDPTLDFIEAVEDQVNARKSEIELGYFRNGNYETTTLTSIPGSLDDGLPLANERIIESSTASLKNLAAMQSEDGSFSSDGEDVQKALITTSLAGLALLSAHESAGDEFASNIDRTLNYVGNQLDGFLNAGEEGAELDPLTASYVGLFLAESNVQLLDENWLDRLGLIMEAFVKSQHASGGWGITRHADESEVAVTDSAEGGDIKNEPAAEKGNGNEDIEPDVPGTFTTNRVLLTIGALERKGMSTENEMVENGCKWLNEQARLRIPSSVDRRTKAALSAGTVAALLALNCDRNDLRLKEYLKIAMERAHDVYTAPQLGLPGLVATALSARQMGNEWWLQFHNAVKHLEVSLQKPDGSVAQFPNVSRDPLDFESVLDSRAATTAQFSMLLTMQSQRLTKLLAIETTPMMVARDSSGKKSAAAGSMAGKPGMQVLQLDAANIGDSEELKKMIMEKLKEQGHDTSKLKIKTSGSPPDDD